MDKGRFGDFGGQYVPEAQLGALNELEEAYNKYISDPDYQYELFGLFADYTGRPSKLYYAANLTKQIGGAKIYLKREDLNHTGSHKINNAIGQALLAKKMGKTRIIAETGSGQHGIAAATAAALLGLQCEVFMGKKDAERHATEVFRMKLLGAEVRKVTSGSMGLNDAINEAMSEWVNCISDTHYVLGSAVGPHPFPTIVRNFQSVIGIEIRAQMRESEGRMPDAIVACVGGGSNAIGAFYEFINDDPNTRLIGCEAAGYDPETCGSAAAITYGSEGVFFGMKSIFLQDESRQLASAFSISGELEYPGIGPEHAWLHESGRAEYVAVSDEEALGAFMRLSRLEGIIPAIESAHAVAHAISLAGELGEGKTIVVCLSGRGDKDVMWRPLPESWGMSKRADFFTLCQL